MGEPKSIWPGWAALTVIALVLGTAVMGVTGRWVALWARMPLSSPWVSVLVAGLGLFPLSLAALALERGRPAPALRSRLAPWVLTTLVYVSVQLSGGTSSPVFWLYLLLGLYLGRHSPWFVALSAALLITTLEAMPLGVSTSGQPPWPAALALAGPLLGVLSGWLTQGTLRIPSPSNRAQPAPRSNGEAKRVEKAAANWPLQQPEEGDAEGIDAAGLLEQDLQASLDLALASHPGWNALALWWGSVEGIRLRGLRLRQGLGAAIGTELPAGEGLLGLVLREQRPLSIEPLAPSAAKTLPYYAEPGPARVLRALPLADEGRLVGLLACDKADEAPFGTDEAAALEALARALVAHAQRAAYLQRLQDAGLRTNKLYDATRSLASSLDRDDLLARFGALLSSVVAQDSWALAWHEEEGGPLLRLASEGYASAAGPALALQQNTALAGILQQADAAVVFNGEASAIPAALNEGLAKPAQHFLLVPLRLGGRLAGVLKLDRRLAPFEEDERENALIFGSQAAITLENARLYSLHQRLATTDGLTGLYNHRYFQERLALELVQAERLGKPLTLALTDIDFFKKFNDTFGHQEGDVVLRKVAQLLKDKVRPGKDIVCRYGGEEFVVILPDCDVVEARQVMDALRAYCGTNLIGGTGPEARAITMSIGLCSYPAGAKEQREIIHTADEALYKAKKTGRDRVCSYKDFP
jgi:diguanylate cyclase (GGDEF)-like protein